jgi:divalent metal cation (Fe/Co/Zn/Cd) transporter
VTTWDHRDLPVLRASHHSQEGSRGGVVSLGAVGSAALVALGAELADLIVGLVITIVILKITWDSWRTVATTEPGDLRDLARPRGA